MFQTLRNAWKIVDLRKKILFTLLIVLVFRIGSAISVPFVDVAMVKAATENGSSEIMNFLTMMSGGGFSNTALLINKRYDLRHGKASFLSISDVLYDYQGKNSIVVSWKEDVQKGNCFT